MTQYILNINAKCSDLCEAILLLNGVVVKSHDGYVPSSLGIGGGDYVELSIDLATGQILNWTPPTKAEIKAFVNDDEDDDDEDDVEGEIITPKQWRRFESEQKLKNQENFAFDAENGIAVTPAFELMEIYLCSTCSEAETRQPARNKAGEQITAFGECEACEEPGRKLFLFKIFHAAGNL